MADPCHSVFILYKNSEMSSLLLIDMVLVGGCSLVTLCILRKSNRYPTLMTIKGYCLCC